MTPLHTTPVDTKPKLHPPSGWVWAKLTEVARLESGHTPSRREPSYWEGGTVPWLSLGDIRGLDDKYIHDTADHPTELGIENSSARLLPAKTVAFCRTASVGKVAILGREMATSQDFVNWVCGPKVHPEYLFYALKASSTFFDKEKQGTTHKTIYMPTVEQFQVVLPPLPEQKRIAAILDKADAIRRKRQEALRLTDELLRSAFLEMFGDPVTNPKGWEVKKLGTICSFVGGGTPSRGKPEYFTGSIPWATSKDVRGEVFWDSEEHVTEGAIENSATKLVPAGTLLIVVKSKVLMHRLPVTISRVPVCFGQDLKGIVLNHPSLRSEFVLRLLKLSSRVLLPRARGANTEGLTLDHLRSLDAVLPDAEAIERYQQLASRVRDMLRKRSGEEANMLSNSLTRRAFTGRL